MHPHHPPRLDAGINFVDTADVYSFGESEEIVGQGAWPQVKREKIVLATKVHGAHGQGPQRAGELAALDHGRV